MGRAGWAGLWEIFLEVSGLTGRGCKLQLGLSPPPPGYPFSLEFTESPEGVIRSRVVLNWLELSST